MQRSMAARYVAHASHVNSTAITTSTAARASSFNEKRHEAAEKDRENYFPLQFAAYVAHIESLRGLFRVPRQRRRDLCRDHTDRGAVYSRAPGRRMCARRISVTTRSANVQISHLEFAGFTDRTVDGLSVLAVLGVVLRGRRTHAAFSGDAAGRKPSRKRRLADTRHHVASRASVCS